MKSPVILLVVCGTLLISVISVDQYLHKTNNFGYCMTDCKATEGYEPWCYFGYDMLQWDYCNSTDIKSKQYYTSMYKQNESSQCSGLCTRSGEKYSWCFVGESYWLWDICSAEPEVTIDGSPCYSDCTNAENGVYYYYSCSSENGTKICSPSPTSF